MKLEIHTDLDEIDIKNLLEDVDNWNFHRKNYPDWIPDLSKFDLSYYNLKNINFSNVNLSHSTLVDINLSEANLRNSDLNRTNFIKANLYKADLTGANIDKTNFTDCYFYQRIPLEKNYSVNNFFSEKRIFSSILPCLSKISTSSINIPLIKRIKKTIYRLNNESPKELFYLPTTQFESSIDFLKNFSEKYINNEYMDIKPSIFYQDNMIIKYELDIILKTDNKNSSEIPYFIDFAEPIVNSFLKEFTFLIEFYLNKLDLNINVNFEIESIQNGSLKIKAVMNLIANSLEDYSKSDINTIEGTFIFTIKKISESISHSIKNSVENDEKEKQVQQSLKNIDNIFKTNKLKEFKFNIYSEEKNHILDLEI